jgi:hypothetical protein
MTQAMIMNALGEVEEILVQNMLANIDKLTLAKIHPSLRKKAPGHGLFLYDVKY